MHILQYGAVHIEQELFAEQEAEDSRDAMDWQRWFMKRSDADASSNEMKLVRMQVQGISQEQLPKFFGRRDTEGALEFMTQQPRQAYAKWLQLLSRVNPKLTRRLRSTPQLVPLVYFFFMARLMGEVDAKKMFRRYFQDSAASMGAAATEAVPGRLAWLSDALAGAGLDEASKYIPGGKPFRWKHEIAGQRTATRRANRSRHQYRSRRRKSGGGYQYTYPKMNRAGVGPKKEELTLELEQLQTTASPFPEVRARRIEEVRELLRQLEDAPPVADLAMMDLSQIAAQIRKHWKSVHFAAKPYLDAMSSLSKITDNYGADPGSHIVNYFLSNASAFRGPEAKAIKAELKKRVKAGR